MIVVTGAAGFIGSNLVAALNEAGCHDVLVCDWLGSDSRWMNLRKAMFTDFVFPEHLLDRLEGEKPRAILHMGANSATTATDGDDILRTNLQYTLRLLDWCTRHQVPLIYASSAATYGDGASGFADTFDLGALRQLRPLNLYGWSKHQVDLVVADRAARGLPLPPRCIGLKFFNVYGPNEFHKGSMMSVVGKCYPAVRAGEGVDLFRSHRAGIEDGGQLRDFIHVDDVVAVVRWFAEVEAAPAVGVFNVGTGKASSFRDFVGALFEACGQPARIRYVDMPEAIRDKYQYFTEAEMSRLRAAGYRAPFMDVREGVARYVDVLRRDDPYR